MEGMEQFQAMLRQLKQAFLEEVPERLVRMENLLLDMEKLPDDTRLHEELFRHVHSLKGSGGTHGITPMSTACHQWESFLQESTKTDRETFTDVGLKYLDILSCIVRCARQEKPDYSQCEQQLETLHARNLGQRRSILIAESSRLMCSQFHKILAPLNLQITTVDSGVAALERLAHSAFHLAILGGELRELNAHAVIAALRLSASRNSQIPVILVTSNEKHVPHAIRIDHILKRDQHLPENLAKLVPTVLGESCESLPKG